VTKSSVITVASHIVGRGADFIVQPDVLKQCEGLHVIITYLPTNNKKFDQRMLVQEIGRTARMGNPGSHDIIVKNNPPREKQQLITVSSAEEKYYHLMSAVYKKIKVLP